jgi:hypothetical protein
VGRKYGESSSKVVSQYKSEGIKKYLKNEQKKSAGKYILVDTRGESIDIVTSPGYHGGYIYCKKGKTLATNNLTAILKNINNKKICIKYKNLMSFVRQKYVQSLPIKSIFKSVTRIPPRTHVSVHGSVIDRSFYNITTNSESKNIKNTIEETVNPLNKTKGDIYVMYSGGIDSTSLYLALREAIGSSRLKPVTVDIPQTTNSKKRSKESGKFFGIEADFLSYKWPPEDSSVTNVIVKEMKKDIVNQLNPHWAVISKLSNKIILTGQNFDSALTHGMSLPRLILKSNIIQDLSRLFKTIVKNVAMTDIYSESYLLQLFYKHALNYLSSEGYIADATDIGYKSGIISTGVPNYYIKEFETLYRAEIREVFGLLSESNSSLKSALQYITYQHNAAKTISTTSANGCSVELPAMWTPFSQYGLHKSISLSEAYNPKQELYSYVKQVSGIEYPTFDRSRGLWSRNYKKQESHECNREGSKLRHSFKNFLRPSRNKTIEYCDNPDALANTLKKAYNMITNKTKSKIPIKLINIELIIRNSIK